MEAGGRGHSPSFCAQPIFRDSSDVRPGKPSFAQWRVIALLVISVAVNYIDRGSLSSAAPLLSQDLFLRPDQMGLLFSAFFWSYAGFMVMAGWLADRFPIGFVLGAGYLVWSLATLGTGFTNGLYSLLAMRLLL